MVAKIDSDASRMGHGLAPDRGRLYPFGDHGSRFAGLPDANANGLSVCDCIRRALQSLIVRGRAPVYGRDASGQQHVAAIWRYLHLALVAIRSKPLHLDMNSFDRLYRLGASYLPDQQQKRRHGQHVHDALQPVPYIH